MQREPYIFFLRTSTVFSSLGRPVPCMAFQPNARYRHHPLYRAVFPPPPSPKRTCRSRPRGLLHTYIGCDNVSLLFPVTKSRLGWSSPCYIDPRPLRCLNEACFGWPTRSSRVMSGTFFYPQSGPATGPELLNYGIYPILGSQNFRDTPAWLNLWRGPALFNTLIVFVILESLFISLYLYSRMLSKTTKEWDVWLMLFAFLFNVGLISAIFSAPTPSSPLHLGSAT